MRTLAAAFAVLALAGPVHAVPAMADETEHITRTLTLEPGGTLQLKNFSGHVTITGTDRSEVVIDATRRAARAQLDRIKLDIHSSGSTVSIDANRRDDSWWGFKSHNVVDTDFEIKVPRRTKLDLDVFSSPVTVTGVEGPHTVHGFSSPIVLNDVTGSARVHTFSGPVTIREKSWQPDQTIDVETFSGSIDLRLPDEARGTVTFSTFSGHLDSQKPLTMNSSSRRSLRAELGGGGGGTLRFKTFSGSVKIDK
jgi:DUF4097 and DUF4098 domain-containing protein YvlB